MTRVIALSVIAMQSGGSGPDRLKFGRCNAPKDVSRCFGCTSGSRPGRRSEKVVGPLPAADASSGP